MTDLPKNAISWEDGRVIRAEVIRALLLGAGELESGWAPAIRIRGARITGQLDLANATVACPLICEDCYFDDELLLAGCRARTIQIVNSYFPAFNGTGIRTDGILDLRGCVAGGALRLANAKIAGPLSLRNAMIGDASGTLEALAADGLAVDGGMDCAGINASGSVSLQIATISGSLDFTDARIVCPGGRGLLAYRAVIGGGLRCRNMIVEGETALHHCSIAGSLVMAGAKLDNPGGMALTAGGLKVEGGVFFDKSFTSLGEIRMIGVKLGANFTLSSAELKNPGGIAINLDRAAMGVFHAVGITCEGQIRANGARIAGDVDLSDARIGNAGGQPCLSVDRASVDGVLNLYGLRGRGEVSLRLVQVGRRVLLKHAKIENPGRIACRLSRAQVTADVLCGDMIVTGEIRVAGATIGGELSFKSASIQNSSGIAIDAAGLRARELSLITTDSIQGTVNLAHARIEVIRDDPRRWPGELSLDGLTYQALDPLLSAERRLRWLAIDAHGYQSQPYEQLASYYNAMGQPAQARTVMYAKERAQRSVMTPVAKIWSVLQDVTVGYGYKPRRALAWLFLLLAAGSLIFGINPPHPFNPSDAPAFNSIIYTLDLLLPVADLGQKHAFNPTGTEQWFSYLLIAVGWLLVTTVAAGAARILSRR